MRAMKAKTAPSWTLLAIALMGAMALGGCNRATETKGSLFPATANHVSPPPVTVPRLPPGSFDAAASRSERAEAASFRSANDVARARAHADRAVMLWPGDVDAWTELAADCAALNDLHCQRYAGFFRAKVEFVSTLPPRIAVLGFASLDASGVGVKVGDYVYDQQTLDTALRLASFYDEQDQLRDARPKPSKTAAQPAPTKTP